MFLVKVATRAQGAIVKRRSACAVVCGVDDYFAGTEAGAGIPCRSTFKLPLETRKPCARL